MDKEKNYEEKLFREVETPTDFQKDLHCISGDGSATQVFIKTHFNPTYSIIFKINENVKVDNNSISFICENKYDFLVKTIIVQELPSLKIKDEYKNKFKIRWTENIFNHILPKSILTINDTVKITMDEIYLDGLLQIRKDKNNLENTIEDFIKSQEWVSFIPSSKINIVYPWFYNKSETDSFPFLGQKISLKHKYEYRNKISDLIQLIQIKNEKGEEIQQLLDKDRIALLLPKILDIENAETVPYVKLLNPNVFSLYSIVRSDERDMMLTEIKNNGLQIYYEDIETIETSNEETLNKEVCLTFNSAKPINKSILVARNIECLNTNYYSNYTSDMFDSSKGFDVIEKSTIYRSNNLRIPESCKYETNKINPYIHGYNTPKKYGYHYNFFGMDSDDLIKYGIVFNECKYIIKLKDCNPYVIKENVELDVDKICESINNKEQYNSKYKLYLRFVVIKSFDILMKHDRVEIEVKKYQEDIQ